MLKPQNMLETTQHPAASSITPQIMSKCSFCGYGADEHLWAMYNADVSVCTAREEHICCSGHMLLRLAAFETDVSHSDSPQTPWVCVCLRERAHHTISFVDAWICVCVTVPEQSFCYAARDWEVYYTLFTVAPAVYWFRWSVRLPLCISELIISKLLPQASLPNNPRALRQTVCLKEKTRWIWSDPVSVHTRKYARSFSNRVFGTFHRFSTERR